MRKVNCYSNTLEVFESHNENSTMYNIINLQLENAKTSQQSCGIVIIVAQQLIAGLNVFLSEH